MPGRAAGENRDVFEPLQQRLIDLHFLEKHRTGILGDAAEDGFARCGRLLEDFLEHEVLVAGLLRHDRIPEHPLRRFRHGPPEKIREHDTRARDDGHLLVAQEDDVPCVAEDGGNVGRDEELAVAEADDDGRTVSDGDDLFGIVGRNQHEREETAHQQQRPPHGVLEAVVLHLALDQVRDDFRVGFGDELVALALQFVLEIEVVFDDPVVHDDDLAGAIAVRVGVFLGGPAVRRPSRVADAVVARNRVRVDGVLEVRQLAGAAPEVDDAVAHDGHARRVVAAVLELSQPVNQDGDDLFGADVADNPTHTVILEIYNLQLGSRNSRRILNS